jgi:hypothetical protein
MIAEMASIEEENKEIELDQRKGINYIRLLNILVSCKKYR